VDFSDGKALSFRSPDVPITRSPDLLPPPPHSSQGIPDWRGFQGFPPCSFVSFVVRGLGFNFGDYPILAIPAISSMALCLRPSARPPPPITLLLKIKGKVPFERTVNRTVEAPFSRIPMPNRVCFNLSFILFSNSCYLTHFNQQRNVLLYHLFALLSSENAMPNQGILHNPGLAEC